MKKIYLAFSLASLGLLSGCSYLLSLVFYNNSSEPVEICNLRLEGGDCKVIPAHRLGAVLLTADRPGPKHHYQVNRGGKIAVYEFKFGPYPEHVSEHYCEGFFMRRCDVPVQLEESGLLYWGGKSAVLPVQSFPEQPPGFPVAPIE